MVSRAFRGGLGLLGFFVWQFGGLSFLLGSRV